MTKLVPTRPVYDLLSTHDMRYDDAAFGDLTLGIDPGNRMFPSVSFFDDDGEFLLCLDLDDLRCVVEHLEKIESLKAKKQAG